MRKIKGAAANKLSGSVAVAVSAVLSVMLYTALAVTATPGTAEAADYPSRLVRTVALKFCTTETGLCAGSAGPVSGALRMICWKDDSAVPRRTGAWGRWFYAEFPNGRAGYVYADYVARQTQVPSCRGQADLVAADWAMARYGQTRVAAADNYWPASTWSPGPVGEWAGDCPKIPQGAWRAAGRSVPNGHALEVYRHYKKLNKIRSGPAPIGAIVYYNKALPWGHTAISIGNGYATGTTGLDHSGQANAVYPTVGDPSYLGWTIP